MQTLRNVGSTVKVKKHTPNGWLIHTVFQTFQAMFQAIGLEVVRAPKGVLLLSVLFILLGTALRTLHKVLASALPPSHIPTPWGLTTACTFNTLRYIVNHQWLLQQNDDANQWLINLENAFWPCFKKHLTGQHCSVLLDLGLIHSSCITKHLMTKNFNFPSVLTCANFSHNLCILAQEPQCATLGAVVISTLKKKVPVIYLFAGFQE